MAKLPRCVHKISVAVFVSVIQSSLTQVKTVKCFLRAARIFDGTTMTQLTTRK